MKKVLITGASGLIGNEVVDLLQDEWLIYATTRQQTGKLSEKTRTIQCDLSSDFDASIFPEQIDRVIHLAQSEHFRDFPTKAKDVFYVNTLATLKLLEYARSAGAKTFIYASSGGVYGYGDAGFTENDPIITKRDLGFYLGTKLCSEVIVENYSPYMNIIILRFFFVYGPRQKEMMLIPRLIRSVQEGKPISLQGKNGIHINPTYVKDAAKAVINSLKLVDSHKINIGGPEVLSLREIGDIIGEVIGKKPVYEIDITSEPKNLIGDTTKMTQLLTKHSVTFKQGIQMILA